MISLGQYALHLPISQSAGNVQVTNYYLGQSYGGRCKVAFWNSSAGVRVSCYDVSGAPPEYVRFTIGFVT